MRDDGRSTATNSIPLKTLVVVIEVTRACNARCSMCVRVDPAHRGFLSEDALEKTLVAAAATSGVRGVSFTGGEPLIFRTRLIDAVRRAHELGLEVGLVTNAFWARSGQRALQTLGELKAAGLTTIVVSTDTFHQDYVPYGRAIHALTAARECGVNGTLNWVSALGEDPDALGRVAELARPDNVSRLMFLDPIEPPHIEASANGVPIAGRCPVVYASVFVAMTGEVFACCCPTGSPVKIGCVKDADLEDIIREASKSLLIRSLALFGPAWLARLSEQEALANSRDVSICQLCSRLLFDPVARARTDSAIDASGKFINIAYKTGILT